MNILRKIDYFMMLSIQSETDPYEYHTVAGQILLPFMLLYLWIKYKAVK